MANEITQQQVKEKFVQALKSEEIRGIITLAVQYIGWDYATIRRWRLEDPEFDEQVQEAIADGKEQIGDIAEGALVNRILKGDTTAIIFALKNLKKENYGSGLMDLNIDNRKIVLNDGRVLDTVLKTYRKLSEANEILQKDTSTTDKP